MVHQTRTIKCLPASELHKMDLILAGHTHGGQIFPFTLLVRWHEKFLKGLYQITARTQLYVHSGTGFWGPPIRFLAPNEITHFTLSNTPQPKES